LTAELQTSRGERESQSASRSNRSRTVKTDSPHKTSPAEAESQRHATGKLITIDCSTSVTSCGGNGKSEDYQHPVRRGAGKHRREEGGGGGRGLDPSVLRVPTSPVPRSAHAGPGGLRGPARLPLRLARQGARPRCRPRPPTAPAPGRAAPRGPSSTTRCGRCPAAWASAGPPPAARALRA